MEECKGEQFDVSNFNSGYSQFQQPASPKSGPGFSLRLHVIPLGNPP